MKSRALRRHHKIRIRQKRAKQFVFKYFDMGKQELLKRANKYMETPKVCSCYLCGNPRKFWKEETCQEVKSRSKFESEIIGI